jgi:hypothetical protein
VVTIATDPAVLPILVALALRIGKVMAPAEERPMALVAAVVVVIASES